MEIVATFIMNNIYPAESSARYLLLIIKGCNDSFREKDGRTYVGRGCDEVSRHVVTIYTSLRGNCLSSFVSHPPAPVTSMSSWKILFVY